MSFTAKSISGRTTRLLASSTIIAGGLLGAALFGGVPLALADQDPAADPPNCSAADLEGVRAGVSAATSAYLFTHPDVNNFVSSLHGLSRSQVSAKMKVYMAANPQVKDDMTGIRQPLVDLKDRCAAPPSP
jgi:hemophore-related protein